MNILVTGAAGALGRNLVENLKAIRDGKNRTRPQLKIEEIYEYDRDSTPEELDKFCEHADFIVHAAGVNRPKDNAEFMEGNFGFTSTLLNTLKLHNNKAPILITSSVQATLSGRFGNSEYGRSKLAGEELMFKYGEENASPVYVYRFENMVGKWIRPRYNSAVATFCYCIARDEPITVNDPSTELEMVFFDDLCEEIYDAMEGHPHRCSFPPAGTVIDGEKLTGVEAVADENGKYCHCPVKHKVTLGRIVELLKEYREYEKDLMIPDLTPGSFEKKLYSMYISYLPSERTVIDLKMNVDGRGSFTELLHAKSSGQVSVNITKPGVTKGMHWHNSKLEQFIVVAGHGLIQERKLGTDEVESYEVDGSHIQTVFMKPGFTHSIKNIGDTDLVTVMWANEVFDSNHPDTFYEVVDMSSGFPLKPADPTKRVDPEKKA